MVFDPFGSGGSPSLALLKTGRGPKMVSQNALSILLLLAGVQDFRSAKPVRTKLQQGKWADDREKGHLERLVVCSDAVEVLIQPALVKTRPLIDLMNKVEVLTFEVLPASPQDLAAVDDPLCG